MKRFANPTNVTVAWSNITTDGTLRAGCAENLATNGVPEWWLHQDYPVSNDSNVKTNIPATPPANWEADTNAPAVGPWFYRVRVE